MDVSFGETRAFCFPCFDFNGIPTNSLALSGVSTTGVLPTEYQQGGTLKLGREGYWRVWAISATMCQSDSGGLANNSDINIQIFNAMTNEVWFNMDYQNTERNGFLNLGAPLEAIAGKWGNPKMLRHPRILGPGQEVYLKGAQFTGATPTGRSPMYVVLFCQLIPEPAAKVSQQVRGIPSWIPQHFSFTGANILDVNQSVTKETQLGSPHDYLITSIQARYALFSDPGNFPNEIDPRFQEPEILLSVRGSSMQNNFFQPQATPVCLVAGQFGARNIFMPSFYRLKKGDSLITKVTNQTLTDIENDLELTFTGLLEGAKQ